MATTGGGNLGGRTRKEETSTSGAHPMAGFEKDRVRSPSSSAMRDGKRDLSGKIGRKESSRARSTSDRSSNSQAKMATAEDVGAQVSVSENRFSSVSLPRRLLKTSMAPILSLQKVRITKASTGEFVLFVIRVAALEGVRRVSKGRCPQVWWGLQGISLLQTPPFSWFQRWAPVRRLAEGTQSFSKPLIILSLATAVSGAVEEIRHASDPTPLERVLTAPPQQPEEERPTVRTPERRQRRDMANLRQALASAEVDVPERLGDEELGTFYAATNGNMKKFVARIQKTVKWRQTYYFLSDEELRQWSHLVSWHEFDSQSRPVLVIHLGLAYTALPADQRPRFCQAVVSQMEYGVLNLLNDGDRRITVIMDCKGTSAIGFPINMMKSCAVLVQDNFPTRLAVLFAINLPPVVRVLSSAVMQVVGQATREKLHLLGDVYLTALSELVGGTNKVPVSLGGACHCSDCMEVRISGPVHQVSYESSDSSYGVRRRGVVVEADRDGNGEVIAYEEDRVSDYQSYNTVLRVAIIGFLMLWILLALVAAYNEPDLVPS